MEGNGAVIARRLLATLECCTLLLTTLTLILHSIVNYIRSKSKREVTAKHCFPERVLISNTDEPLGRAIQERLQSEGCTLAADNVNALIVVGAAVEDEGLDGLSDAITRDVWNNLKLLESLVPHVRAGGRVLWVSSGVNTGPFASATEAFDNVIKTQLELVARRSMCVPIWLGRHSTPSSAVDSVISSLIPATSSASLFSIRNGSARAARLMWRWLKKIL